MTVPMSLSASPSTQVASAMPQAKPAGSGIRVKTKLRAGVIYQPVPT
jgi:hypothetical protein